MPEEPLPSWRTGQTKDAILSFFALVDQIPVPERVAVFDNDGTLRCEKPRYTQLEFMLRELREAVRVDPELAQRPEYRALIEEDASRVQEMGLERVLTALVDLSAGITPEEFDARVRAFFDDERHPDRDVPYRNQRYQPMLELVDALRAHQFDVYVVSAGGAEFVRTISQEFYAVPPEGVVGSQIAYDFVRDDSGVPRLVRTAKLVGGPNEGEAKVPNIQRLLGRRPVVAGGNSAGDAEMLEYAMAYPGPSLALLVDHDDTDREYAYESVAGTFAADESITQTARRLGWTVASIQNDWSSVFVS